MISLKVGEKYNLVKTMGMVGMNKAENSSFALEQ